MFIITITCFKSWEILKGLSLSQGRSSAIFKMSIIVLLQKKERGKEKKNVWGVFLDDEDGNRSVKCNTHRNLISMVTIVGWWIHKILVKHTLGNKNTWHITVSWRVGRQPIKPGPSTIQFPQYNERSNVLLGLIYTWSPFLFVYFCCLARLPLVRYLIIKNVDNVRV